MKTIFLLLILFSSLGTWAAELLSTSIPKPFYKVDKDSLNNITLINRPEEALQMRIDLIRSAKERIEAEYFIFDLDVSGRILTREFIAAAQRGVKVRLLVDGFAAVTGFNRYHTYELAKLGVELKHYNWVSYLQASTAQFRTHRKILTVDDKAAITGGRNVNNEYYNLSENLNFDDRDVLVEGPMVKVIRESFDAYFDHRVSKKLTVKNPNKVPKKLAKAREFFQEAPEEKGIRLSIANTAQVQAGLRKTHTCPELTYSSDAPGANFGYRVQPNFKKKFRHLRKTIKDKMLVADKNVIISTPYFSVNKFFAGLMHDRLDNKVPFTVYSNSLAATDAVFMSATLYVHAKRWVNRGLNLYLHDGKRSEIDSKLFTGSEPERFGTHAKSHVYEGQNHSEIYVGSYNVDNRSDFYNAELGIFCKGNDELTQELKDDIIFRAQQGIKVKSATKGMDRNGQEVSIYGTTSDVVKRMKLITIPSRLIEFLL